MKAGKIVLDISMDEFKNADKYFSTRQSFGQDYITSLTNIMQPWTAPVLLVCCFVSGVMGALLGKKLLKKRLNQCPLFQQETLLLHLRVFVLIRLMMTLSSVGAKRAQTS